MEFLEAFDVLKFKFTKILFAKPTALYNMRTRKIVFVGRNLTSLIFIVFLAKYVPFFSISISTQISTVALEKSRSEIMAKLPSGCSTEIIRQLFGMRAHIMRPIT